MAEPNVGLGYQPISAPTVRRADYDIIKRLARAERLLADLAAIRADLAALSARVDGHDVRLDDHETRIEVLEP